MTYGNVHFDDEDEIGGTYEFDKDFPTLKDAFVYAMTHYEELAKHFCTNTEVEISGDDDDGKSQSGLVGERADGTFVFFTEEPTGDGYTLKAAVYEISDDGTLGRKLKDDER